MSLQLALIQPESQYPSRQRLLLHPRELYRVPPRYRQLRVVAGMALVTQDARDIILPAGQTTPLPSRRDVALVSPLGDQDLIFELL